MNVTVETLAPHEDPRGSVWEPMPGGTLASQRNCHLVLTEPGGVRGNHFHRLGTETAIQHGPALAAYRDSTGTHTIEIPEGTAMRFTFPPGCPHAFLNNGRTPNLLIAFNTHPYDPEHPDT